MVPFQEGSGQSWFLVNPNQKGGRTLETLVWRVVATGLRNPEFRTQFNLQAHNKTQRQ